MVVGELKHEHLEVHKVSADKVDEELQNKKIQDIKYEQLKKQEQSNEVNQRIYFSNVLSQIKCVFVVLIALVFFVCILAMYYVAVFQFIGKPPSGVTFDMTWLIKDTVVAVLSGLLGWLICKYFK